MTVFCTPRFVLAVCFAVLAGCSDAADTQSEPLVRPTKLMQVATGAVRRSVRLPAVVQAAKTTELAFQVPGRLEELPLVEGQDVLKGALLAQLDLREFENSVTTAQAEFTRASSEYDRAAGLLAEDAIAASAVEQRQAQRDTAKALLSSARKQLDDATLRAPFDAVVADVHAERFQTMSPQQPVVTLQSDGPAEAVVQVPASIVIHEENSRAADVVLELDAAKGVIIPAVLSENATLADPGTQTFEVRFRFDPPTDMVVLPGMTGVLSGELPLRGDNSDTRILVPYTAVIAEDDNTFVWVVDTETMLVSKRAVSVDVGSGSDLAVQSGLLSGETIVRAGGNYLFEGAQVRAFDN